MEEESPLGTIYKNKELESIDWTEPEETEKFVWFWKRNKPFSATNREFNGSIL